jgi:RNA polymerase sigma-70 factor, ECF subfamily
LRDEGEFEDFYAAVFDRLVGQLYLVTGNLQDAEDVVQEALTRAAVRWSRLRRYRIPEAWVRRVAMNLASDGFRRVRPESRRPAEVPDLAEALRALPMAQRKAVVLHHLLDLPVDQVAVELGVPVGTVKSRLARARGALATLLASEAEAGRFRDQGGGGNHG